MASTEFFASQQAGAHAWNTGYPLGATGGVHGYKYQSADATVAGGAPTVIVDNVATWGTVAQDDWIRWDPDGGASELRRVASVVDANLTVAGAALTPAANKVARVGGAGDDAIAWIALISDSMVNAAGSPVRLNVEAVTWAANAIVGDDGTAASPITIEAFRVVAGDATDAGNGGEAVIDATGLSQHAIYCAKDYIRFKGIYGIANGASKHGWSFDRGDYCHLMNCRGKGTGASAHAYYLFGYYLRLLNCVAVDSTLDGFNVVSAQIALDGCQSYSAGQYGFFISSSTVSASLVACISHGSVEDAFYIHSYSTLMDGCIGYGSSNGSGLRIDSSPMGGPLVINCIFESNTTGAANTQWGIECDDASMMLEDYNAFYNNGANDGSNDRKNILFVGANDVVQTAGSFFVDAPNKDMRINDIAGRGALLRGKGFPGPLLSDA